LALSGITSVVTDLRCGLGVTVMPSRWIAAALLALAVPGWADEPSTETGLARFDAVGKQLRQYAQEKDIRRRVDWLLKLAPTRDPRVAVLLGESFSDPSREIQGAAEYAYFRHFLVGLWFCHAWEIPAIARKEWRQYEAMWRRRAKEAVP
jgi:hypothetical protein